MSPCRYLEVEVPAPQHSPGHSGPHQPAAGLCYPGAVLGYDGYCASATQAGLAGLPGKSWKLFERISFN